MNSSGGPLANTRSAPQPFLRPHPEAEQQLARALLLEQSHAAASNLAALRRPLAVSPLPTSPHHVYQLPLAIQPSVAFRPRPLPPSRSFSSGFPTPAYVQLAMQQQLLQQQQLELEWQFQRLQQVRNMQLLASQSGASGLSPSTTPDLHPVGWNPPIGRPSAAQTLPRTVTPAAAGYPNYQLPARPYLVTTPVPAVKGPTPKAAIPSSVSPITGQSYQSSGQHEGDEWDYSSPSKVHTRQVYGSESSFSSAVPPQLTITKDHAIRGVQVQKGPTPTTNSSKSTTVLLQSLMALMDDSSFLAHGESTGIYRRSSFRDLSGTFDSVKDLVHITNPSTDSVDKRIELMGKSARKEINEGKPYPVIGPRSDSMALDSSGWEREKGPSLHRARSVRRGATGSKPSSVGPSKKGVVPSPRNKHRNPLNAITNAKLTEESDPPQRNPLSNVNVNLAAENVEPLHLKATDKSRSSLSNEVSLAPSKVESPLPDDVTTSKAETPSEGVGSTQQSKNVGRVAKDEIKSQKTIPLSLPGRKSLSINTERTLSQTSNAANPQSSSEGVKRSSSTLRSLLGGSGGTRASNVPGRSAKSSMEIKPPSTNGSSSGSSRASTSQGVPSGKSSFEVKSPGTSGTGRVASLPQSTPMTPAPATEPASKKSWWRGGDKQSKGGIKLFRRNSTKANPQRSTSSNLEPLKIPIGQLSSQSRSLVSAPVHSSQETLPHSTASPTPASNGKLPLTIHRPFSDLRETESDVDSDDDGLIAAKLRKEAKVSKTEVVVEDGAHEEPVNDQFGAISSNPPTLERRGLVHSDDKAQGNDENVSNDLDIAKLVAHIPRPFEATPEFGGEDKAPILVAPPQQSLPDTETFMELVLSKFPKPSDSESILNGFMSSHVTRRGSHLSITPSTVEKIVRAIPKPSEIPDDFGDRHLTPTPNGRRLSTSSSVYLSVISRIPKPVDITDDFDEERFLGKVESRTSKPFPSDSRDDLVINSSSSSSSQTSILRRVRSTESVSPALVSEIMARAPRPIEGDEIGSYYGTGFFNDYTAVYGASLKQMAVSSDALQFGQWRSPETDTTDRRHRSDSITSSVIAAAVAHIPKPSDDTDFLDEVHVDPAFAPPMKVGKHRVRPPADESSKTKLSSEFGEAVRSRSLSPNTIKIDRSIVVANDSSPKHHQSRSGHAPTVNSASASSGILSAPPPLSESELLAWSAFGPAPVKQIRLPPPPSEIRDDFEPSPAKPLSSIPVRLQRTVASPSSLLQRDSGTRRKKK